MTLRERLIESRKSILTPIEELEATGLSEVAISLKKHCKKSLDALEKEIEQIEKELDKIIDKDTNLKISTGWQKAFLVLVKSQHCHCSTIPMSLPCSYLQRNLHVTVE